MGKRKLLQGERVNKCGLKVFDEPERAVNVEGTMPFSAFIWLWWGTWVFFVVYWGSGTVFFL